MNPLRVLIADDNKDAAESLSILLGLSDHDVRVVSDGSAALSVAKDWPPDLAVLDLDMPVMNGFATALALHERFPGVLLVALSGFMDGENLTRARVSGFDLCFAKGVGFRDFRMQVEALVERKHRDGNQQPTADPMPHQVSAAARDEG